MRTLAVVLMIAATDYEPDCVHAQTTARPNVASKVARLDPWSRSELALGNPRLPRKVNSVGSPLRDVLAALKRERPKPVAAAGGPRDYARTMSIEEIRSFKGFVYEQDLIRRLNRAKGPMRYELAAVRDEVADIVEHDRSTGRIRRLQAYSGGNPWKAVEKLLLSDRAADKVLVPKDCYSAIRKAIEEAEALVKKRNNGQLGVRTANRQIRSRLAKAGLKHEAESDEVFADSRKHGRGVLGRLGTSEISGHLKKLVADKQTSDQIYRRTFKGLVDVDPHLRELSGRLDGGRHGATALELIYQQEFRKLQASGRSPWRAGREATNVLRQFAPEQNAAFDREVRRAILSGVPDHEIRAILDSKRAVGVDPRVTLNKKHNALYQSAKAAQRMRRLRSQGVLLAFSMVGATADYALSDQELREWIRSERPMEWGTRAVIGTLAIDTASRLESRFVERSLVQNGKRAGASTVASRVGRRAIVGGAAAAIFVAGEGLIAVVFQDATLGEAADKVYEAALVFAIAEGAVVGADVIFGAVTGGSIGGPFGIAIALGAAGVYEGVKYVWTSRRDLEGDRRVFTARCESARRKVTLWSKTLQTAAMSR